MGSSRKHKEKREKKKHRRSRSRSYEKDSRKKTHKKDRERRRSRDRYDDEEAKNSDLLKRTEDSKKFSQQDSAKYISPVEDDDEFDVDQMLDSKLSEQSTVSSKKTLERRNRLKDFKKSALVKLGISAARQAEEEDSLEKFATQQLDEENGQWAAKDDHEEQQPMDEGPLNGGQAQLSLSVSEANKLRAKLGLKPLEISEQIPGLGESSESETKPAEKNEVFVKTENIADVKSAEKMREKLQTLKEKRKIADKLRNIKPLAASDSEEEESAAAWVKKSRKLEEEKEQAMKRAKLLEEMDAEFGIGALVEEEFDKKKKAYSSRDLRGLKVGHDALAFKEGQNIILTLKDKGVLDEDEDVLQNVNLLDDERHAKNIERRKKKPDYQPYEEDYDEFGILKKKNMLSKYDEEIHGEEKKSFVLGSASSVNKDKEIEMIRQKLKQQQGVTLEMPNMKVASEYYTSEDMVQFKRPKKKKKLRKRELLKADDLLPESDTQGDIGYGIKVENLDDEYLSNDGYKKPNMDVEMLENETEDLENVVVDEERAEKELDSALSKARKLKLRRAVTVPEMVVSEAVKNFEPKVENPQASATGPIVLNSTAEFCRTLGDIPTYGMSGNRDEEADELMDFERELIEERQRQELEAQNRGAWNEVDIDDTPAEISIRENEPILEEEPDISLGVAGALQMAQKKGYLDKDTKKLLSGPRASHLQAQSYTIEEKFYDDDKFGKRDRYTGPIQDFREKNSYKPDVKLEYIDDNGRLLNAKEAFRYLSHKFHGKGPGKNKVDKRMKKLDQDTKLKQMSSTDTPLNTVKLLQAKQKETQSPYIVLSGGSKALTQTMISKTKTT